MIREYLQSAGYRESFLLAHFGVSRLRLLIYPSRGHWERFAPLYEQPGTAVFLARVLIAGLPQSREAFRAHVPDEVFAAMAEAGLLEQAGDAWQAAGLLFPYEGFFVFADRAFRGAERLAPDPDYVAGGVDTTSLQFYDGLSRMPCRTLLEMGTGSGVGALLGSRVADQVWALDINDRSVAYARRNCEWNGVENVTVLASDLFGAVDGLRFERMISNLPFVPSTQSTPVFAAGGEDGEQILAGFLGGCAERLEPGGRVYALVMGSDREDDPFEERLRRYLGEGGEECDVALFVRRAIAPIDFAFDQALLQGGDPGTLLRCIALFQKFHMEQMVLGTLIVQRRRQPRGVFTLRRTMGSSARIEHLESAVDWQTRCMLPEFVREVLPLTPRVGRNWEVLTKHMMQDGQMATVSYSMLTKHPYEETLECAPWVVSMALKADGDLTVSQLLAMMQKQTGQPGEALLQVFAQLVGLGIVELG